MEICPGYQEFVTATSMQVLSQTTMCEPLYVHELQGLAFVGMEPRSLHGAWQPKPQDLKTSAMGAGFKGTRVWSLGLPVDINVIGTYAELQA